MGRRTKIDWCDATWNPVTGCLHGCEYCYARNIANRFGGFDFCNCAYIEQPSQEIKDIMKGMRYYRYPKNGGDAAVAPYPFGFTPTIHREKLDEPQKWKKPKNIFVCSMADLFGDWVPDEWIREVFRACDRAHWHRYIFLTKNPKRYTDLVEKELLPDEDNYWFGTTTTTEENEFFFNRTRNTFTSIEPILEPFREFNQIGDLLDWIIVGAETGNRKDKIIPQKEWIMEIANACKRDGIPLFMKESLRTIIGDDFRQEFPWEVKL